MRGPRLDARRMLHLGALLFVVAGLAALVWPVAPPSAAASLVIAAAPALPVAEPSADTAHATTVVSANVFSTTRRPPRTRYLPGVTDQVDLLAAAPGMSAPPLPAADPREMEPTDSASAPVLPRSASVPRLHGIVSEGEGGVALMRLDPALPGARAYREGDRGGAFRVVRIEGDAVTLDGPGGRRTLRLAHAPPRTP